MRINIKFIVIAIIILLAAIFGFRALQNGNSLSADVENQTKTIEQLSR